MFLHQTLNMLTSLANLCFVAQESFGIVWLLPTLKVAFGYKWVSVSSEIRLWFDILLNEMES